MISGIAPATTESYTTTLPGIIFNPSQEAGGGNAAKGIGLRIDTDFKTANANYAETRALWISSKQSGTYSSSGTNYSLYVEAPTAGASNVAAYFGGNVGIGTATAISDRLFVYGTSGNYVSNFINPTITAGQSFGISVSAGTNTSDISFNVNNAALSCLFRIRGDGLVGVGTTQPTAKLDVNGSTGYNQVRMRTSFTPTGSADASGNVGDIAWDASYIYVKTAAGAWKRTALSTF